MTRPDWHAHTTGEVSCVAATPTTLLAVLMPARRCVVRGMTVTFAGQIATSKPVLVELVRLSTAGTMDAGTSSKKDPDKTIAETLTVTQKAAAGHVNPTVSEVARVYFAHPQMGFDRPFTPREEYTVPASARIGVRCTADVAVSAVVGLDIDRELPTERSESFTTASASTTTLSPGQPIGSFSLQVSQVGTVTSWTVGLEGSNDGTTFTTLLTHEKAVDGNGTTTFSGANIFPVLYYRANVSALTLGAGTSITVAYAGMEL